MSIPNSSHDWIVGPSTHSSLSKLPYNIDTHRHHRGPYTGAGELARQIVRHAYEAATDLFLQHQWTLISIAPEIRHWFPVSPALAKALTFSREGNSMAWTLRQSHGLVDFILDYFERTDAMPTGIAFTNVDHAEPLDREFIAILLRRANPEKVRVRITTTSESVAGPLAGALRAHARITHIEDLQAEGRPPGEASAARFVESDCASEDAFDKEAYRTLTDEQRRRLHAARLQTLVNRHEDSLMLGAIPFHTEQAGLDIEPLLRASTSCIRMGYYDASRDWASRGRRLCDPVNDARRYGDLTRNLLFSLLLLGRYDAVEALCEESRARSTDPAVLAHCAYALAILNARLYELSKRDYAAARSWIETSMTLTAMRPASPAKTVNIAFLKNTMALVEMREKRPQESVRLLSEALEFLLKEAPEKYGMESIILLHNRARVFALTGQSEKALEDFATLLRFEPSSVEAHFDRAVLYHRIGRYADALADYDAAIYWSPPYAEAHFNRALTLASLGRKSDAVADYSRVLTLDPENEAAVTNRACLLFELDELEASEIDVETGLAMNPENARLLCLQGIVRMKRHDLEGARRAIASALRVDPSLAKTNSGLRALLNRLSLSDSS